MEADGDRRTKMLALVQQWRASGKRGREFAREHGITVWTLYYWRDVADGRGGESVARRRLRRRSAKRRDGLVPVRVVDGEEDGELEVIIATGDRVRVPATVSLERFQRVLQIVKAC